MTKSNPIWNTQDRQVATDDLDKTKNTNAVELASLTALSLGVKVILIRNGRRMTRATPLLKTARKSPIRSS